MFAKQHLGKPNHDRNIGNQANSLQCWYIENQKSEKNASYSTVFYSALKYNIILILVSSDYASSSGENLFRWGL